jgi:hypothetical protein
MDPRPWLSNGWPEIGELPSRQFEMLSTRIRVYTNDIVGRCRNKSVYGRVSRFAQRTRRRCWN